MKMRILTLLMLTWAATATAWAGAPAQPGKQPTAYLMVYHKDQDHGLHMAISRDGYTWTALNDDKPVIAGDTIAGQRGIRDPHIFRGPDGAFYLFIKTPNFDANEFSERAKKYNILVVPCDDFGVKGYVRLAYCVDKERIKNSLPSFKKLIEEYK